MAKYREKPVIINAIQWTGKNLDEIEGFAGDKFITWWYNHGSIGIQTLGGTMIANLNDWIIKGIKGEFYPCKPDIFLATYEKVMDAEIRD